MLTLLYDNESFLNFMRYKQQSPHFAASCLLDEKRIASCGIMTNCREIFTLDFLSNMDNTCTEGCYSRLMDRPYVETSCNFSDRIIRPADLVYTMWLGPSMSRFREKTLLSLIHELEDDFDLPRTEIKKIGAAYLDGSDSRRMLNHHHGSFSALMAPTFWAQSPYLASLHLLLLRLMVWISHTSLLARPAEVDSLTFADCEAIIREDRKHICVNHIADKDIQRFTRDRVCWRYLMEKFKEKPINLKTPAGRQKWYNHWENLVYQDPIRGVDFYCAKIRYRCKNNGAFRRNEEVCAK